jgi:hypothetical protein
MTTDAATVPRSHASVRWLDVVVVGLIAAISVAALEPDQFAYIRSTWANMLPILPTTLWAACKIWLFWGAAAAVLASAVRIVDPSLDRIDTVMAGAILPWVLAYVGANAIGPIGLLRTWVIALVFVALLLAVAVQRRRLPPATAAEPWPLGFKLAVFAFALQAPAALILQLGSPVPPFMDIFATPASAQRIVTFGRYLPFDNDPYGYWDPASQLPGLETFYAVLALGSLTPLAVLAETAFIVPLTGMLFLGTYRLGRALAGDRVGGFAALGLFATMLLHVLPYGHGRSAAFVPAAFGLAFCLDHDRNRTRLVIGALALALAVASHAIIGMFAMVTVAGEVLCWLLGGAFAAAVGGIGLLAGATLVAAPPIAVALRFALPYPVLPLVQLVGILVILASARWLHGRPVRDHGAVFGWLAAGWVAYVLLFHPQAWMTNNHHQRFPLLVYGGGVGFTLALARELVLRIRRRFDAPARRAIDYRPIALALLLGLAIEYADVKSNWKQYVPDPKVQVAVADLVWKVDYWYPWVLVFPTAIAATLCARVLPMRVVTYAMLALLFFPWRERWVTPSDPGYADPNYHQHAIAESWAYQLETGKQGYWGATPDRRWSQSGAEFALFEVLRAEVAAGRITTDTHIVQLGPYTYLYKDNLLFPVFTGINGDLYITNYLPDWSIAGGRIRSIDEAPARIAEHPPYVAIHQRADPDVSNVDPTPWAIGLEDYVEIFNQDGVRLLRYDPTQARR